MSVSDREDRGIAAYTGALERIVVFRALPGLGDFLCIVPALRALRRALPETQIVLLGLRSGRSLAQRFTHYIDDFIDFPGFPGLSEQTPDVRALPVFLETMQERAFDLALQLHGSGLLANPLVVLLGARVNAGFYSQGAYCPDAQRFLLWYDDESEVRRSLHLLEHLGVPAQGEALEFPIRDEGLEALETNEVMQELAPGRYVCLHPGAQDPARRWAPEGFAAVGNLLSEKGYQVVLTGTAGEVNLTAAVAERMRHGALDLAGQTSLDDLAVLLSGARLLVCNDTGVSHLAAALEVPSVVVFTATERSNPARWAPLNGALHHSICPPEEPPEFGRLLGRGVSTGRVLTEVEALLQREIVYAG
ncbi:MAG: glycosyltransferase family 9 protein [Anaerolineales bacterium]